MKELKSMAADIITLQEVQKDAYDDWFRPQLMEAGFEGVFQQKKREPIFHRGKYTAEGCATFYKTTRFKRVDKHIVDYDKLSANELNNLTDRAVAEKGLQRLSKGNIALAVMLEDQHIKTTHNSQATGPGGGHLITVVNTHILADPGSSDVKLWQAHLLLRTLEQLPDRNMPLLVCGDFNSTPDSAVYEYCRRGTVQAEHEDLQIDPCGILKHLSVGHSLRMSTAYETCNGREADYTNYTEDFKGTLDYIWFTSETLSVLAISQVDDESQLTQETALPSSTRPSDHVSLVSTFMFKETPVEAQGSTGNQQSSSGRGGNSNISGNPYHTGGNSLMGGNGSGDGVFMPGASAYTTPYGYRSSGGALWS
jgi:CCR4-NOT transcription complex subunit 6